MHKNLYISIVLILIAITVVSFKIAKTPENTTEIKQIETEDTTTIIQDIPPVQKISPKISLSNDKIYQGETLIIKLPDETKKISLNETSIPYSVINNQQIVFLGFDTREKIGEKTIFYLLKNGEEKSLSFEIIPKTYPVTKIIIPQKLADQGVTSKELISSVTTNDKISLEEILTQKTPFYYFTKPFTSPLENWIEVGGFGNVREDANGAIRHLGVDLDAKNGTPIFASNTGKIAFVGNLQNYGQSIVIDHGLQIFSIYLHLSKIDVNLEDLIKQNEKIGETGNSGEYTLEPHLHFSIKIRGISVNPRDFIEKTKSLDSR